MPDPMTKRLYPQPSQTMLFWVPTSTLTESVVRGGTC